MSKKVYLITGIAALLSFWNIEIPKRAFRFYQRGDINKTVEALDRSISKDTLNPAAYHLYSLLYTDTAFYRYDVDTAYLYTNRAIAQMPLVTDAKDLSALNNLSVDSINLEKQKDKIDSLKFIDVKALHTIEGYNFFTQIHDDAIQIPEAIALRNHIGFEKSELTNTWQSYKAFMEEYPNAKDFDEAEKRYKRLIYEERTRDGKYESLTLFLEDFPNTPYRSKVEDGIFNYAIAVNTLSAFRDYLNTYPNEKHAKILSNRAYHIYKQKYPDSDFFEDFDFGFNTDSLKKAQALEDNLWLPKLENGKITFIDEQGDSQLETDFYSLNQNCLCSPESNDFVFGEKNGQQQVIGRNGQVIYEGIFDQAIEAGFGFIIIRNVEGDRLVHKSGDVIIDDPKEEIAVFDNRLIRTKSNGFYGLESIHGIPYLANEYIQIDTFKTQFWLEKEDGIQLVKPEDIVSNLHKDSFSFNAQFDEIEELPNGRIWAVRNDQETILDQQFNTIIPFTNQEIFERPYGWRLESEKGITLIHDRYDEVLRDSIFDQVLESDRWLVLQKDSSWSLLDQVGDIAPKTEYDSLAFWGENMVMLFKGNSTWALFKTGKSLLMKKGWEPKLLIPQQYITSGEKADNDFFMLSNAKNQRKIYNDMGREILSSTYKSVTALSSNMLRLQKRNAALADSTGHYILNFIYDGIGSNNQGYVSILDKGKVGVINPAKGVKIPPTFEKLLEPYADTVLIASDKNYKGFVNTKGKELTAFEFDEVLYYNDTVALTRIEDEWLLYDISADETIYDGVLEYEQIHSDSQQTLLVTKEKGKGVFDFFEGELIEPTYTDIKILGTPENPIYFAMKLVAEADIYIVIYFDKNGNKLFTQSFREDEYFRIACPSK